LFHKSQRNPNAGGNNKESEGKFGQGPIPHNSEKPSHSQVGRHSFYHPDNASGRREARKGE
jgi:hypothetical protein